MAARMTKLALALAMMLGLTGIGYAQSGWWSPQRDHDGWGWQDRDHDRDRDRDRDDRWRGDRDGDNGRWFREGYQDGRSDRARGKRYKIKNRHWGERDDRAAYERGYRAGYEGRGDYRDDRRGNYPGGNYPGRGNYPGGYPAGNYPGRGGNNPYGNNAQLSQAYNTGYQDGLNDGQKDRQTGHSFRPTEGDNYKHADRGYNLVFGDKQSYKDAYRAGYQPAYQRGYYGR